MNILKLKKSNIVFLIVVILMITSGLVYFGIKNYIANEVEMVKEAAREAAKDKKIEDLIAAQQLVQQEAAKKATKQQEAIKELEQKLDSVKRKPSVNVPPDVLPDVSGGSDIDEFELIRYFLDGVVQVNCYGLYPAQGSGSLWEFADSKGRYFVLTNSHVLTTDNCDVYVEKIGVYNLSPNHLSWNAKADAAVVEIVSVKIEGIRPISQLDYSIPQLNNCPDKMPQGSPVRVVGYPAFGKSEGLFGGIMSNRLVTEGVISGYDGSPEWQGLPYKNYFTSAKIDAGNSGGIAFSKSDGELCILGIPTWISRGVYENIGIIQNIKNVKHKR